MSQSVNKTIYLLAHSVGWRKWRPRSLGMGGALSVSWIVNSIQFGLLRGLNSWGIEGGIGGGNCEGAGSKDQTATWVWSKSPVRFEFSMKAPTKIRRLWQPIVLCFHCCRGSRDSNTWIVQVGVDMVFKVTRNKQSVWGLAICGLWLADLNTEMVIFKRARCANIELLLIETKWEGP